MTDINLIGKEIENYTNIDLDPKSDEQKQSLEEFKIITELSKNNDFYRRLLMLHRDKSNCGTLIVKQNNDEFISILKVLRSVIKIAIKNKIFSNPFEEINEKLLNVIKLYCKYILEMCEIYENKDAIINKLDNT